MSRDTVDRCLGTSLHSGVFSGRAWRSAGGLVVASGVEGELAQQFAGFDGEHADVQVGGEDVDAGASELSSQADVVQPGVVAQGDGAAGVDLVGADPVVRVDQRAGGDGFGSCGVDDGRGLAVARARWGRTVL